MSSQSAAAFTHIHVAREILADLDTPLSAYLKLCAGHAHGTFLLESVQGGERWGRYSIVGLPAREEIRFAQTGPGVGNICEVVDGETIAAIETSDPLSAVREYASRFKVQADERLPRFAGGLVGYFGAETIRFTEPKLAKTQRPTAGLDDIRLLVAKDLVIFDNLRGSAFLVTLAEAGSEAARMEAEARLDEWQARLREPLVNNGANTMTSAAVKSSALVSAPAKFESTFGETAFKLAVEKARRYIHAGDCMQVVLSQALEIPFDGAPLDVYRVLRAINPSPYLYFLDFSDVQVAGSSPEVLVRVQDDEVTVRPIAGTRPRGRTEAEDLALEKELHADPKERAEHLMLIDLGRNDTGRVSETGSVRVTETMLTERYSHVMHIVSNVTGRLKPELDALDALAATFPAGTLSGAPKIRALEIIDELEPAPRGIYSGAIGYLGWQGELDTAIAIRTAVVRNGKLTVQAGAGVVYDSDPQKEWDETMNKSRALLKAVELVGQGMDMNFLESTRREK